MISVPAHFTSGKVTSNGVSLAYYRTGGQDKPVLIMAHGMTDMGLCWTRIADALRHKYDVIVYDARGHGQSDSTTDGHEPERRAADLAGLIESLGLEKCLLLGHSMGAMTVGLLAATHAHYVRAVVLEDPPLPGSLTETPSQEQLTAWGNDWARWKRDVVANRARKIEELISTCRRQSPWWHDSEITPWATAKLLVNPDVFNTAPLPTSKWWQQLAQVQCPLLIITSEVARGALITERAGEQLRDQLPEDAMLVRLPGAGHNVHREQFDRFMSLTTDFFARS